MANSDGKLRAIVNVLNKDGSVAIRSLVRDSKLGSLPEGQHQDVWVKRGQTRDGE